MIFLATVFIQKRHPYTKGLLSIEQNCGILTSNTCKKRITYRHPCTCGKIFRKLPYNGYQRNVEAYSAAGKIHLRQQVEDQKEYAI